MNEKEIMKFLDSASKEVGKYVSDYCFRDIIQFIEERDIKSPIEKLFYIAFKTIVKLNYESTYYTIGDDWDYIGQGSNGDYLVNGMYIDPQHKIGDYRVDFYISYGQDYNKKENILMKYNKIIVECDSQEFHERTEKERRYEKQRDRFLQKKGYKVFRFTGKEIMEAPYKSAAEVYAYLLDIDDINDILLDSNIAGEI